MSDEASSRKLTGDNLTLLQQALLQQRDKHLEQFMAISGKATFAVLTAIFVVYLGGKDIAELKVRAPFLWVVTALMLAGIGLLTYAAYLFSSFHTSQIRSMQARFFTGDERLTALDMQIIPPTERENRLVMAGLVCLMLAAVLVFVVSMAVKFGLHIPRVTV